MSPTSRRRKAVLIKPGAWFIWQKNCLPRNFKSHVMTLLWARLWTSCSHREILKTVCSIRTGSFCIRQKNYRNRVKINGIIQSMSPRGNCWDNVCTEHFFGALKVESGYDDLLKSGRLLSFEDTKKLIDDFIESYTNSPNFEFLIRNEEFLSTSWLRNQKSCNAVKEMPEHPL